jgi:hypothetical protein
VVTTTVGLPFVIDVPANTGPKAILCIPSYSDIALVVATNENSEVVFMVPLSRIPKVVLGKEEFQFALCINCNAALDPYDVALRSLTRVGKKPQFILMLAGKVAVCAAVVIPETENCSANGIFIFLVL